MPKLMQTTNPIMFYIFLRKKCRKIVRVSSFPGVHPPLREIIPNIRELPNMERSSYYKITKYRRGNAIFNHSFIFLSYGKLQFRTVISFLPFNTVKFFYPLPSGILDTPTSGHRTFGRFRGRIGISYSSNDPGKPGTWSAP